MAVFSFFAEVTRWKMSCCGIEPSASVTQAVKKYSHSLEPPFGQNSNLPASAAAARRVRQPSRGARGGGAHPPRGRGPSAFVANEPGDDGDPGDNHHGLE